MAKRATGTVGANNAAVTTTAANILGVQITGTFTGTLNFEATIDGATWAAIACPAIATGAPVTTATAPGIFQVPCAGMSFVRVRGSSWSSGTATITVQIGDGSLVAKTA